MSFSRKLCGFALGILAWQVVLTASSAPTPAPASQASPAPTPATRLVPTPPAAVPVGKAADVAPDEVTPWPITRYEKLIHKSPFAPATAAPVVATTPGFAANLYLSGLAKIGDRDFVSIASRDQTSKFSLYAGETNADGIQLVSVQWADAVGKSKVTVKKGTEFGVLEYDQAILQKAVQLTPPAIQPPGMMGQPQPPRPIMIPRPNQPGQPEIAQPAIPTRRRSIIRNQQP